MKTNEKLLGSIYGAALGDAMGALTETRSAEMIKEDFGGFVETLFLPPEDCFAHGMPLGTVTDDFSLAYFTGVELVKSAGVVDEKAARNAVLEWAKHPEFFRFAGPTTQAAVLEMEGGESVNAKAYLACDNSKATNGAGMKI